MNGNLIVIEGNNASGKKTQTKLLFDRLKKEGYRVRQISFPQYDTRIGKVIGRYLRGEFGDVGEINPYLSSMLYAMDRLAFKEKIIRWLEQGYTIVTDRYVESNMAFQAAKLRDAAERKKFMDFIDEIEYRIGKLPKPDLIVYLDVPLKVTSRLHEKKQERSYIGKKKDIHERNAAYLTEVEKMYQYLAKRHDWKKISCIKNNTLLSKAEIADKIFALVKPLL